MIAAVQMQAAMFYGAGDIRVESVPIPTPKADQVKIKIAWCGICGSDLHEYAAGPILCPTKDVPHALTGATLPICLGHEFSGTLTEVGPAVRGDWQVGDRVVVEPVISCSKCYSCTESKRNACNSLGFVGLSGGGGGMSEYICINGNDGFLHHLPDNVSMQEGALVEPLAVAMHAVQAAKTDMRGQTALVVGAGPIGCFVIKCLLSQGAAMVVVSEPSAVRRAMATRAGAHHVFDPMESNVVSECQKLTGGSDVGVAVSFECAGKQKALDQALGALRTGGTCVNVAIWDSQPKIDMNQLLLKERTLTGVICYNDNHTAALESLANGSINLDGFVTATIAIKDVVKLGFEELIHHNERHVKILVSLSGVEPASEQNAPS